MSSAKNVKGNLISVMLASPTALNPITRVGTTLTNKIASAVIKRFPIITIVANKGLDAIEAKIKEYHLGLDNQAAGQVEEKPSQVMNQ
jgi:hypothetical protein